MSVSYVSHSKLLGYHSIDLSHHLLDDRNIGFFYLHFNTN